MIVAVAKETAPGERRVALVPESVKKLIAGGAVVRVERAAGAAAGFTDAAYADAGAQLVGSAAEAYAGADFAARVQAPSDEHIALLRGDAVLIGFLQPLTSPELLGKLAGRRVTAFAMEMVPRITRAQKMDALSSQSNIAGYKAALVAADSLGRLFPMLMTAAGTIAPAKVLVIGAGVAGLQAIATARRLGAVVEGYDIRPETKEQVESLGAKYVGVQLEEAVAAGGYAKEVSEETKRKQREQLHNVVKESDVVITTANVPGRKAPVLISRAMVEAMRPGSVIVDLAAESGGNCELTQAGTDVEHGGVRIIGPSNVPAMVPYHASQMYSRNVQALIQHLLKDDALVLDFDDEITRGTCVVHGGEVRVHAG